MPTPKQVLSPFPKSSHRHHQNRTEASTDFADSSVSCNTSSVIFLEDVSSVEVGVGNTQQQQNNNKNNRTGTTKLMSQRTSLDVAGGHQAGRNSPNAHGSTPKTMLPQFVSRPGLRGGGGGGNSSSGGEMNGSKNAERSRTKDASSDSSPTGKAVSISVSRSNPNLNSTNENSGGGFGLTRLATLFGPKLASSLNRTHSASGTTLRDSNSKLFGQSKKGTTLRKGLDGKTLVDNTHNRGLHGRGSGRCTISIAIILGVEILIVLIAFIVIIVFSTVQLSDVTADQVRKSMEASLNYASASVESPIENYENFLFDIRERYISRLLAEGRDPCSESNVSFSASAGLFSEFNAGLKSYPHLTSVSTIRRSTENFYTAADVGTLLVSNGLDENNVGLGKLVQCGAMRSQVWTQTNATGHFSSEPVASRNDLKNLDSIAFNVYAPTSTPMVNLRREARGVLNTPFFKWYLLAVGSINTQVQLLMIGVAPMWVTGRNLTSGAISSGLLRAPVKQSPAEDPADAAMSFSLPSGQLQRMHWYTNPAATLTQQGEVVLQNVVYQSTSSFSAMFRINQFIGVLAEAAIKAAGSHASLYDVSALTREGNTNDDNASTNHVVLMATSLSTNADETVYNTKAGQLWRAGYTPFSAINDAYRVSDMESLVRKAPLNNPFVDAAAQGSSATPSTYVISVVDDRKRSKDTVVGVILQPPSAFGLRLAIVLGAPRSHYYEDVSRVQSVTIGVAIAAIVVLIAMSLFTGLVMFIAMRKILSNMSLASSFRTDKVEPILSRLSEIDALEVAFVELNGQLTIAKAYLPQHLLPQNTTDDDDDDESDVDLDAENATSEEEPSDSTSDSSHALNARGKKGGSKSSPKTLTSKGSRHFRKSGGGDNEDEDEGSVEMYSRRASAVAGGDDEEDEEGSIDLQSNRVRSFRERSKSASRGGSPLMSKSKNGDTAAAPEEPVEEAFMYEGIVLNAKPPEKPRAGSVSSLGDDDFDNASNDNSNALTAAAALDAGVSAKRVTILAINGRQFYRAFNMNAPGTILRPTEFLTEMMALIAKTHRGVIDSFHGDHFVMSFNAARHNAEGPLKACRAAMEVLAIYEHSANKKKESATYQFNNAPINGAAAAGGGGQQLPQQHGGNPLIEFSMGIATGKAIVGHLGSSTLKRLSIVGPVYSKAIALEALCRRYGNQTSSAMSRNIHRHSIPTTSNATSPAAGRNFTIFNNFNANTANALDSSSFAPAGAGAQQPAQQQHVRSSAIQCITDGVFVAEVQHSCVVQVVGAVPPSMNSYLKSINSGKGAGTSGGSGVDGGGSSSLLLPPAKLLYCIRSLNGKYKNKLLPRSAALKWKENREAEEAAAALAAAAGEGGEGEHDEHRSASVLKKVKATNGKNNGGKGNNGKPDAANANNNNSNNIKKAAEESDEWMYEINNPSDNATMLPQINTAVLNYFASAMIAINRHQQQQQQLNTTAAAAAAPTPAAARARRESSSFAALHTETNNNNNNDLEDSITNPSATMKVLTPNKVGFVQPLRRGSAEASSGALYSGGDDDNGGGDTGNNALSASAVLAEASESLRVAVEAIQMEAVRERAAASSSAASAPSNLTATQIFAQLSASDFYGALAAEYALAIANTNLIGGGGADPLVSCSHQPNFILTGAFANTNTATPSPAQGAATVPVGGASSAAAAVAKVSGPFRTPAGFIAPL